MGLNLKEIGLRLVAKVLAMQPVWTAKIDGAPAEFVSLVASGNVIQEIRVELKDQAGQPVIIEAEHPLVSLGNDEGDEVRINGADVENDDVDEIIKLGFPRATVRLQFEYGAVEQEHRIVLEAKVNLLKLLTQ